MISVDAIINFEANYARSFAVVEERDYGRLFFNRDNPNSHDSNHALVLDLKGDLPAAIADITSFYQSLGIVPRISHGFVPGAAELLLPRLLASGWKMEPFIEGYFVHRHTSTIRPLPTLTVRRVQRLTPDIEAIVRADNNGAGEWVLGVLERQLRRPDFHLLAGLVGDTAVTMASLDLSEGLTRIDDVVTHPAHRRRGYGNALIHHATVYHQDISNNALYLYSSAPGAIKIYEAAGFRKLDWLPYKWSAWLPA